MVTLAVLNVDSHFVTLIVFKVLSVLETLSIF